MRVRRVSKMSPFIARRRTMHAERVIVMAFLSARLSVCRYVCPIPVFCV